MHVRAPTIVDARQPYRWLKEVLSGAVKYKTEAGIEPTQAVEIKDESWLTVRGIRRGVGLFKNSLWKASMFTCQILASSVTASVVCWMISANQSTKSRMDH